MKHWIHIFLELTKIRISLFVTLSASVSFILASQGISLSMIIPLLGIFLLACGSCGLNQYQEREYDQWMERTRGRPIPSKKILPMRALVLSFVLILSGALILFFGTNRIGVGLGIFALFWYHLIYTPLKRKTPFAVIPGALVGAIPPMIGWVSGGGDLFDSQLLAISFLFYIWQVPHFWILHFYFGKDYEKGGFPALTRFFTQPQFNRILFVWIFATGVASFVTPWFGVLKSPLITGGLFAIGGWLVWKALRFLIAGYQKPYGLSLFKSLNTYILLVMVCFALDSLTPDQIHSFLF
ncbi:MAG: protoheme IX farnesyltransferase [Deltaproteobacteria bacterium]|nr:protoheme IX farnesyltransferase [Deltaproteobacteria bacterium]